MKRFIRNGFKALGYQVKPLPSGQPSPIHLWKEDEVFQERYQSIRSHTLVSEKRCHVLYQFARQVANLPGDVTEIGVYRGGTARLLAKTVGPYGKEVHLFDTFSGMPPTDTAKDLHVEGAFGDTSLEAVSDYLQDCENVHLFEGMFPATAQPIEDKVFSLVHVDVDIYQSVIDCCHFFYNRLPPCGVMVFDDYGDLSCPGAKQAVDEFFADKPESPCYLPTGQCLLVKH